MQLEINGIFDKGTKNERVSLNVLADLNLKEFMLVDIKYFGPNRNAEKGKHIFSFPSQEVKKGDLIVIYSGLLHEGKTYSCEKKENNESHFFGFGFEEGYSIWSGKSNWYVLSIYRRNIWKC